MTEPGQMAQWRGSPGWHVERETVTSELRPGGRHHHVKVRDDDPSVRVTTDALFTDSSTRTSAWRARRSVVIRDRPGTPLELRVVKTGRDGTLVRIIQGPYDEAVAYAQPGMGARTDAAAGK